MMLITGSDSISCLPIERRRQSAGTWRLALNTALPHLHMSPRKSMVHYFRSGSFSRNASSRGQSDFSPSPGAGEPALTEGTGSLYLESFVRTFLLGVACGALLEGGHVALQVLAGTFPGVKEFSPLIAADHVVGFASWVGLSCVEAWGILSVLRRFNFDTNAAASDLRKLRTLPRRMLPLQLNVMKRLLLSRNTLSPSAASVGPAAHTAAPADRAKAAEAPTKLASSAAAQPELPSPPKAAPAGSKPAVLPPRAARNSIAPAPGILSRRVVDPAVDKQGGRPPLPPLPDHGPLPKLSAAAAKRQKELLDRESYLTNFWYAAALSEKVKDKPVKVELCGKEMVLFRGEDGRVRCVDNACPHRGAPLSGGWLSKKEGHDCIVCPYHGWAFDEAGSLRDVPAAASKGEWPKRALLDAYDVEEKGGFVWLFFGNKNLPMDARPPIPYVPELDDPNWKAVYEEMEFDCNHFAVFENAIDMAHIHYLHSDSFGNQGKPEIRDMESSIDEWSVTATFSIHNKPVNAFWSMFQVPAVKVTARAYLPSTSMVTFTLGNGLSFTTFVNTVPVSANKSINRFALIRNLSWDKSGLFNASAWDGMARDAMIKILSEDKEMVEQLKYGQLPAEYSVRADLPQVGFRKLRQQYADMGYTVPPETVLPAFARNMDGKQRLSVHQ